MVTQMFYLIGLFVYGFYAVPWIMDTIGTGIIASVIATIVTYFVGIGMLLSWRPWHEAPRTNYHDYDRYGD